MLRFTGRLTILIVAVCCMLSLPVSQAQDEVHWYWAWGQETGQLVAYTIDGLTHTLIEEGVTNVRGWRLGDELGLALLEKGDEVREIHLLQAEQTTPLQPITDQDAEKLASADSWTLVALSASHAVLAGFLRPPDWDALLVDLKSGTYAALPGLVFQPFTHLKFSEDGRYLRYMSRESSDAENQTLYERKLETGAERVITTFDEFFPVVRPDRFGDYWLSRVRDGENMVFTLMTSTGQVEAQTSQPVGGNIRETTLLEDYLVTFPVRCESNCPIILQPIPEGEPITLTLPATEGALIVIYLRQLDDTTWLVTESEGNIWLLSSNGEAEYLGIHSPKHVPQFIQQVISADGRYVLAVSDRESSSPQYGVWDTTQRELVLQSNTDSEFHILQMAYGEGGFLLTEDVRRFWLYRYSDEQVVTLPENRGRVYFEALAGGDVLFSQRGSDDTGIYRYDPTTDTSTLLVADVWSIYM